MKRFRGPLLGVPSVVCLFTSLLVVNALQMASALVAPLSGRIFRRINRWCANTWWGACVFWSRHVYQVDFVFSGDKLPMRENTLVVANHQSMADILVLMPLALQQARLGDLKWFAKDVIKYFPGVGWGMLFLDCLFLKRDWLADRGRIDQTFSRIRDHEMPFWVVSFSEGTRRTPEKLEKSQEYARGQGWPVCRNVMVPRTKGFVASIQGLGARTDAVYDVSIHYDGRVPTLWEYVQGLCPRVRLHVRRYPVKELPTEPGELSSWLLDRFREKDEILDRLSAAARR